MDTGAPGVSSTEPTTLIRALVDGSYNQSDSPSFQDFSMNQSESMGDGKSLKSHFDILKDASEIKISQLQKKNTVILSEEEKLEKKATLKDKKAEQCEKDRVKLLNHLHLGSDS